MSLTTRCPVVAVFAVVVWVSVVRCGNEDALIPDGTETISVSTGLCPSECYGHGKCMQEGDTAPYCVCDDGFQGLTCSSSVRPVKLLSTHCPSHCSGHGICQLDTRKCKCDPGFEGANCGTVSTDNVCASLNRCSGQGECTRETSGVEVCECADGFTGDDCSTVVDVCNCRHGKCVITADGQPQCECEVGYAGSRCDDYRRGLDVICYGLNFCSGKGTCLNGECSCHDSFSGKPDCSEEKAEGMCPMHCSGHGRCSDVTSTCMCMSGWAGANCSDPLCPANYTVVASDAANASNASLVQQASLCNARGVCEIVRNGTKPVYGCKCDPGYNGTACDIRPCPDGCLHGTCRIDNVTQIASCECADGWSGPTCAVSAYQETDLPCCPNECSNHGVCVDCVCDCSTGFTGDSCETMLEDEDEDDGFGR